MDGGRGGGRLSFSGRPLGPGFERRVIHLAPGSERAYDGSEWLDAIVVVERGEIELECWRGDRVSFASGDVLFLGGLPLRALRNRGEVPVLLSAVSRRR